jgi:DNA mismatch repair protein MSH4
MPLPADVLEHAGHVSATLEQQTKKKRTHSIAVATARRRKLLLNLKEHLVQAQKGTMDDQTLREWLKDLQKEFVVRMTALDEEARRAELGLDDEDDEDDEDVIDEQEAEMETAKPRGVERGRVDQDLQAEPSYRDADGIEHVDLTGIESRSTSVRSVSAEL